MDLDEAYEIIYATSCPECGWIVNVSCDWRHPTSGMCYWIECANSKCEWKFVTEEETRASLAEGLLNIPHERLWFNGGA